MFRQILICSLVCLSVATASLVGGAGPVKEVTRRVQDYVNEVRPDVEQRLGENFDKFEAVVFRTQVVNGVNYFVKVNTGGDNYVFVRFYVPFGDENAKPTLSAVQANRSKEDKLEIFG